MTVEFTPRSLRINGQIAGVVSDAPLQWSESARGRVLEVGLGFGLLANAIASRPAVTSHVVVERAPEVVAYHRSLGSLPESATVIVGAFPDAELPMGEFDIVYLDIFPDRRAERAALELVADRGALFVRRT